MASVTLLEASKLSLDDLVVGVIENIVTVNPMYAALPFTDIDGNSLRYNREATLGDVQTAEVGATITAKAAATYSKHNADLTTLIGDAEVNGLIQAQRVGGDQVAQQIGSKAKQVGRKYQDLMINGDSANAGEFDGLIKIVADIQANGTNAQEIDLVGAAFTFEDLDNLLMQVKSKDGQVDFLMMNARDLRKVRSLKRALGGTDGDQVTVNGVVMESYAGVPIYRNDYIVESVGNTVIFAGCFDDGSQKVGISGLTAAQDMGIHVQAVGASESKDEDIYRVKFYSGFAAFSELSIAMLKNVAA